MKCPFRLLAGAVFMLYLTLVNVAAWCDLSPSLSHGAAHQHSKPESTHSQLCDWACQVSVASSTAQISTHILDHHIPQVEVLALKQIPVAVHTPLVSRSTRAPPHSFSLF